MIVAGLDFGHKYNRKRITTVLEFVFAYGFHKRQ